MPDIERILDKAKSSPLHLWLLNRMMGRLIPFNSGHGFAVSHIDDDEVRCTLPLKKRNLNHIRGLHACALATLAEFTTGFRLLTKLGMKRYRIIMQKIEMEYFYQGKTDAMATFRIDDRWLEQNVLQPLGQNESVVVECEVEIHDTERNHLCTGRVSWQVKDWEKVRLRI
ncbi:MAG: DUF4442 domain-containing protein [Halofilum sp. (in: g-proteobacteria)]|nr:DUF4442 domain-containing protein [Halofilum sp. (in: g-proteobacteria)]